MPVIWPTFISAAASTISSQQFTKPGGLATQSYEVPKVGSDQVEVFQFPTSKEHTEALAESVKPGNPVNANLATNPANFTNIGSTNLLSGRYDFGVAIAQDYLNAVKNAAQTPVGAFHINNPVAEEFLKNGYGLVFERMLKEGDLPLMDQKDADGNIISMGKESHPDYADLLCPEPVEPPDPIEEEKKRIKKFNKFIEDHKNDPKYDLRKFKFFEFHCLDGNESNDDIIAIFANRILQKFDTISKKDDQFKYLRWATSLGKQNYKDLTTYETASANYSWRQRFPYPNVRSEVQNDIQNAGYNWEIIVDGVSRVVKEAMDTVFPAYEVVEKDWRGDIIKTYVELDLYKRVSRGRKAATPMPKPSSSEEELCSLDPYKIQVSYNREKGTYQAIGDDGQPKTEIVESKRPKILTDNVVTFFTYDGDAQRAFYTYATDYVEDGEETNVIIDNYKIIWWDKDSSYVNLKYVKNEYENKWSKIPPAVSSISPDASDPEAALNQFLAIDPKTGGTLFKFQYYQTEKAKQEAEECDANEPENDIPYSWPGGDPYEELAQITITYWYMCIVKPFQPLTSMPPALIPPPLTGIYIPIYYGGKKRLANNLRRAWNTGKTFSQLPAPQPPAFAVATALSFAYAMHMLEFKLIYLGGIPTPIGPVPMVGFVPVVF